MFVIRISLVIACAFISAALAAPTTRPATTSVTQPTAANLEVHEWAVFVVDAATGQMNPQGIVSSTLPGFVTDHRFGSGTPADAAPAVNNNNGMVFNGRFWFRMNQAPSSPAAAKPLADSDMPSPVGIIRLVGSVDSKVDVSITAKSGSFLGSWPKAEDRSNQLLWRDLTAADRSDAQPPLVGVTHWFTELRSVRSAFLTLGKGGNDRFLLYDLEMPYPTPLNAKSGKDFSVEISNPTSATLHDLTLYQGDRIAWRTVSIGELSPTKALAPTTAPATAPTIAIDAKSRLGVVVSDVSADPARAKNFGYQGNKGLFVEIVLPGGTSDGKLKSADIILNVDGKETSSAKDFGSQLGGNSIKLKVFRAGSIIDIEIALHAAATSRPVAAGSAVSVRSVRAATSPVATTGPAPTTSLTAKMYQLTSAPSTQPSDLAETWKPIMASAGIDPVDANVMTRVIARYAFDPHRLTAVYRMDDAEFDRLLPIEIVPQPNRIKRLGLVIVINVDPAAGTIVDDLITQLGDQEWSKRDAAYQSLAAMGPAATAKLNAAKGNTDLEIAWRAEKLLAAMPAAGK